VVERDVSAFVRAVREDPAGAGFVLDFDGTLSAIAPTPADARPLPGAAVVLATLALRYPLVAILSGRRAEDVWALIPVPGVRYLGLYGAEELHKADGLPAAPPQDSLMAGLVGQAKAFVVRDGLTGAEVEDKGDSVALHYRNASSPDAGDSIRRWAQDRARLLGLQVRPGKMVVELTPPGPTKADALERLVAGEGLKRLVVAGDDLSDVEALRRAGELLGPDALRIGVRSPEAPADLESVSDVTVPGPEGVLELLSRFA
jgi:trehalose 6-phosphate phosphatase